MHSFWSAIDVSDNLQKSLAAIRGIRGLNAAILAAALGGVSYGLFWLVWYFDVGATLDWTQTAVGIVAPSIPASMAGAAGALVLAITLLPTLIELFTARFAREGIIAAGGLVFAFSLFDMITDWPRVVVFMDAYAGAFDRLGFLRWPVFHITRLLWLFMASFGFELLFIVFAVTAFALLLQAKGAGRHGAGPSMGGLGL
jgi:hypothetical protein